MDIAAKSDANEKEATAKRDTMGRHKKGWYLQLRPNASAMSSYIPQHNTVDKGRAVPLDENMQILPPHCVHLVHLAGQVARLGVLRLAGQHVAIKLRHSA